MFLVKCDVDDGNMKYGKRYAFKSKDDLKQFIESNDKNGCKITVLYMREEDSYREIKRFLYI